MAAIDYRPAEYFKIRDDSYFYLLSSLSFLFPNFMPQGNNSA